VEPRKIPDRQRRERRGKQSVEQILSFDEAVELVQGIAEEASAEAPELVVGVMPGGCNIDLEDFMAELLPSTREGSDPPEPGERPKTIPGDRLSEVRAFAIESPELITIEPGQDWRGMRIEGSYVRFRQSVETTDQEVEIARDELLKRGAVAVRVMPRPKTAVLMRAEVRDRTRETLRGACLAIVEASASRDKAALRAEVEAVLSKEGI
jgi:hypothetical protein